LKLLLSGFIIFAALITSAPRFVQSQSTTGTDRCAPLQRKELVVSVLDPRDAIIDSLRAEHLALKVGDANAKISDVTFQINKQPLDVVLLIDVSISQKEVLPLTKAGAKSFIAQLAEAGQNRVAVVSFSDKPTTNAGLTSDFADATAAIDRIDIDIPPGYIGGGMVVSSTPPKKPVAGSTSLWDVIRDTTQALSGPAGDKRRRVIVLFSDGTDTASSSKMNSVIEDVMKNDIAVYSIGVINSTYDVNEGNLKKLSEHSGGTARFPKNKEGVYAAIDAIAQHLHANYVIGYCGEVNDRRKVRVEITWTDMRNIKPILAYKRF
jgi:VWFA-related protein